MNNISEQNDACITVGLLKTTAVNFPGHLAAAVFLPGCNLRCDYCYNGELACADFNGSQLKKSDNDYVTLEEVFKHLEKRRSVLSALAISGGEPFASPHLQKLISTASALGYKIKIDTNGLFPDKLQFTLAQNPNISMIALDIKTAPSRYFELLPHIPCSSQKRVIKGKLQNSISFLKEAAQAGRIAVEYRTVLVPGLVGVKEITEIAALLPSDAHWEFANFLPGNCMNPEWNQLKPYNDAELAELISLTKTFVPNAELR